ncbi:hypothetical protein D1872_302010 [compost metagenome]
MNGYTSMIGSVEMIIVAYLMFSPMAKPVSAPAPMASVLLLIKISLIIIWIGYKSWLRRYNIGPT